MSFKELLAADAERVFLNTEEFAERRTLVYDGETYPDVPVLLTRGRQVLPKLREKDNRALVGDHTDGLHMDETTLHVLLRDIGGVLPEQGNVLRIGDGEALGAVFYKKYRIRTSSESAGMATVQLEAHDE